MANRDRHQPQPVGTTLKVYLRGGVGGLLFSLPMLFTMEVWWHGFSVQPAGLLLYLLVTFALLLLYNYYAGLNADASLIGTVIDSVQEIGVGVVVAAGVLWLLGRLSSAASLFEVVGQVLVAGLSAAIGVSIGTAELEAKDDDPDEPSAGDSQGQPRTFAHEFALGLCGAVLVAASIAPTEEVLLVASETTAAQQLGLAMLSLVLSAGIVYGIDFAGSRRYRTPKPLDVVSGVVAGYGAALIAAAVLLAVFGQLEGLAPTTVVAELVVLGLPATIGASAGRLLLQS